MGSLEYGYVKNAYVEIDKKEDRMHFEKHWFYFVFAASLVSLILANISFISYHDAKFVSIAAITVNCICCMIMMKENRSENTDKLLSLLTVIGAVLILTSVYLMF